MHFNVCIELSKKEILNSLKDEDDLVVLLLYQQKDILIKEMLMHDADLVNSATGYTNFFTFIDTVPQSMDPKSKLYGGNDFSRIPASKLVYNKMLFIGSTFGVGNNYPAVIVCSPKSGEYVLIKMPYQKFKNQDDCFNFLFDNIITEVTSHKKRDLCDMFNNINDLKIGSNYNFDNFDIIEQFDSHLILKNLLSKSNLEDKVIAEKMAFLELGDNNDNTKKLSDKYRTNLSQWKNENSNRKPNSSEIRLICRAIKANYEEFNLLLTSCNYAPLNPHFKKDREIVDDIKMNNVPRKANIIID